MALSIEQLVRRSSRIALCEPVHKVTGWERFAGRRTLVTYTRVVVQEHWSDGDDSEMMVRTLGGRSGDIQQKVMGEAALRLGESSVLFLNDDVDGARSVVAMAQGHYPLRLQASSTKLLHSPQLPRLVGQGPASAVGVLHEKPLGDARRLVEQAR